MRIGIGIGEVANQSASIEGLIAEAKRAEQEGFHSAWLAHIFGMDALTAIALLGRETSRIELGTAVVPTFTRHPFAMAQQALSTEAAASGRFSLGIGLSHQLVVEGMWGLSFAKPFTHMREYLSVMVPLIREGTVSFQGEEFRVSANLSVPGAKPCPILVAALAPKMLSLTGAVADGTITWMTGPKTLRDHTVPRISEAAAKAGRPKPRVVVGLPVAVTENVAAARAAVGKAFQIYGSLPSYRAMLDREGAGGPADVAIVGSEDEVARQILALGEVGATDFLAAPYGFGPDRQAILEKTRELLIELARRTRTAA